MDGTRGALFCVTCDRRVTQRLLAGVKSTANSYASLWRSETPATNVACNGATSFSHFRVWRCRRSRSLPRCMIAAPHARTRAHSLHCCRISTDTARVIERPPTSSPVFACPLQKVPESRRAPPEAACPSCVQARKGSARSLILGSHDGVRRSPSALRCEVPLPSPVPAAR